MVALDPATAFRDAKKAGDGWMAKCPAHDDSKSSLKIDIGQDGKFLLKCFAGCEIDRILSAAHLTMADLFPEKSANTKASITATYKYYDEGGQHLFDVCRFHPKDFRQRRADGKWKMAGVRRVVYHLDKLQGETTVYIPEGEKDVDRLWSLGLTATCNVGGAGKWTHDYTDQLKAAAVQQVVVFPDNDEPGRQHAEAIARSCHAAGFKVKIVALPDLPKKGDVSDWLDGGHTKDDLASIVKAASLYEPSTVATSEPVDDADADVGEPLKVTRASEIPIRAVKWLWDHRLQIGTLSLLAGREGIGKSLVMYTALADITRGRLPGVMSGTPRNVLVAATEDGWEQTIVPRLMAAGADLDRVFRLDHAGDLVFPRDVEKLQKTIEAYEVVATVCDPIMSRIDAELNTHTDQQTRQALEPLGDVANKTHSVITGLIHVNKGVQTDPVSMIMGSRAFPAVARTVLFCAVHPENEKQRIFGRVKGNDGASDVAKDQMFEIRNVKVADEPEEIWTGKVDWLGEADFSIRETVAASGGDQTATREAADWLRDYLEAGDGWAPSSDIKKAARGESHSDSALARARRMLKITIKPTPGSYPRTTRWLLPPDTPDTTDTTDTTERNRPVLQSYQNGRVDTTGDTIDSQAPVLKVVGGKKHVLV